MDEGREESIESGSDDGRNCDNETYTSYEPEIERETLGLEEFIIAITK